jgi:hypothetical protein
MSISYLHGLVSLSQQWLHKNRLVGSSPKLGYYYTGAALGVFLGIRLNSSDFGKITRILAKQRRFLAQNNDGSSKKVMILVK